MVHVLYNELQAAGVPVESVAWRSSGAEVGVDYLEHATPDHMATGEAVVAAHAGIDVVDETQQSAYPEMAAVPGWATWTKTQARTWFDNNIHDPLVDGRAALPPTLTLTTTRIAIVGILDILDQMAVMLWNIARVIIALRNHTWPALQDE